MNKRFWIAVAVLAVLSFIGELFAEPPGPKQWWGLIPGFYAIWGFFGCFFLYFVTKHFGKKYLMKKEGYYEHR